MNIGIMIHSRTGHTLSVAEELKDALTAKGHSATIEKVVAANDDEPEFDRIILDSSPDYEQYEALIIGAPVRGAALSPAMKAYLTSIPSLSSKKIECFVTEFFPFPSMGGNQAIKQMKTLCEEKGGEVVGTGIINWSNPKRNKQIAQLAERQAAVFN